MQFPSKNVVEALRKTYTPGAIVELVEMNDAYREMPAGLRGVVRFVRRCRYHSCGLGKRIYFRSNLWRRQSVYC